mmetsp:Transcript_39115/g.94552  ORF Transcript_39115/g.94552 Transcript_39115/m.94552 type:complete len:314 (+) Transcript_39115:148-1089(+)
MIIHSFIPTSRNFASKHPSSLQLSLVQLDSRGMNHRGCCLRTNAARTQPGCSSSWTCRGRFFLLTNACNTQFRRSSGCNCHFQYATSTAGSTSLRTRSVRRRRLLFSRDTNGSSSFPTSGSSIWGGSTFPWLWFSQKISMLANIVRSFDLANKFTNDHWSLSFPRSVSRNFTYFPRVIFILAALTSDISYPLDSLLGIAIVVLDFFDLLNFFLDTGKSISKFLLFLFHSSMILPQTIKVALGLRVLLIQILELLLEIDIFFLESFILLFHSCVVRRLLFFHQLVVRFFQTIVGGLEVLVLFLQIMVFLLKLDK